MNLNDIRARRHGAEFGYSYEEALSDVDELLAEVERLRAALAGQQDALRAPTQPDVRDEMLAFTVSTLEPLPENSPAPEGAERASREVEAFRAHLEEVGRPVQIARDAVVNRAREVAAIAPSGQKADRDDYSMMVPCGPLYRLGVAVQELERHEAKPKPTFAERASQPEPAKGEPGVRSLCNSSDACVLDDGHKEPCSRIRPTTQGEP